MQKISTCLWYNGQAEEAANFYISIFKNSKITNVMRMPEGGPAPAGTVMSVNFVLEGNEYIGLNGGPQYSFTPAISFFVKCNTQEEIDHLWDSLSDGGREDRCGWLQDKFGVSWQIVPPVLGEMLGDKDRSKASRVMNAMLKMRKLEIAVLKQAFESK